MKTENEWISVKERLPDVLNLGDGNVCKIEAKDSEGEFDVLYGTSGAPGEPYSFFSQRNITHWRVKKTLDPMNTEQLKTKEELLDKYANEIGNYKDFRGILVAYKLCMDDPNRIDWVVDKAMQDFASQESKRAVDEFKEKLRKELQSSEGGRTRFWNIELFDLIDKL